MHFRILYLLLFSLVVIGAKAQTPTVAASAIVLSNVRCSEVDINWTSGNGTRRIVIATRNAPVSSLPVNGTFYLPSDSFGVGHSFDANTYVVYNGTGNGFKLRKLENNTTYYLSVFEHSGGATNNYLTTGYPETSVSTENLSVSFTTPTRYQCELNNSFPYTSNVVQSVVSPVTYDWDFGDGGNSNLANPTHSYAIYGKYLPKLTVSTPGCEAEYIGADTVAPVPIVAFELDTTDPFNTQQQCLYRPNGDLNEFSFINKSVFPTLSTSIDNTLNEWKYGDGTSELYVQNTSVDYKNPGTYEVKFIARSTQNGIVFCIDSISMIVEVRPVPLDTTLLQFDTVDCFNDNYFEFTHDLVDPTISYNWKFGDNDSAQGRSVNHSYGAEGVYWFEVDAIDANGCSASYSDTVVVLPQPNNIINGLEPSYCENDPADQLVPTLPGGVWMGVSVDDKGLFTPSLLGPSDISYEVNVMGCVDTTYASTMVYSVPVFELGGDTNICSGGSVDIEVDQGNTSILWSTGETDSSISISTTGLFWVQRSQNGCTFRDSINITELSLPLLDLGIDSLLCGDGQRIVNVLAPDATFTWSDGYAGGGQRIITQTGNYSLTVTNKCGTVTDDVSLEFLPYVCDVFIPSAFSPNGDGLNDVFQPVGNVDLLTMQVYNSWGELLYQNTPEQFTWNGTYLNAPAPRGQYYYVIRYLLPENGTQVPRTKSGEINLIR